MEDYNKIKTQKLETSSKKNCYLLSCNGIYYEANDAIVELMYLHCLIYPLPGIC